MARKPRQIVPRTAHHILLRGNRRECVFQSNADYQLFLLLLRKSAQRFGVRILLYCLMPNHVHFTAVPPSREALIRMMHWLSGVFTQQINAERGWTGHIWESRYRCLPMNEHHLLAVGPYILMNPVRAGLVASPDEWTFSSVHHLIGTSTDPVIDRDAHALFEEWRRLLRERIKLLAA